MVVERRGSRRRRGRWALAVTCALLAVGLAVLPQAPIVEPWIVPPLQALVPLLCVAALVAAAVLLFFRRWLAAGVLAAGGVLGLAPVLVPGGPPMGDPGAGQLTILSLNAEYAGVDAGALAAAVDRYGVEILVLVEADEGLVDDLRGFGALESLPYRTEKIPARPQGGPAGGSVILSAHPLRSEGVVPRFADYRHFEQPVAVVEEPELGPVRVVAIHPVPPVGVDFVPSWNESLRGLDGWASDRDDLPLVLAGDFNASRAHPQFRDLADGLATAAGAAGPIPWPTWPAGSWVPPFTAIDHVLLRGLVAEDYLRLTFPGTDHRGLVTTVRAGRG
jgi:endonuclease/exonuclease/phosphatase (EEP) superfamily protein YafD